MTIAVDNICWNRVPRQPRSYHGRLLEELDAEGVMMLLDDSKGVFLVAR